MWGKEHTETKLWGSVSFLLHSSTLRRGWHKAPREPKANGEPTEQNSQ